MVRNKRIRYKSFLQKNRYITDKETSSLPGVGRGVGIGVGSGVGPRTGEVVVG